MKKILVPCDFSKPAVHAFRYALRVAKEPKASIHLLFVAELPLMPATVIMPVMGFETAYVEDITGKAEKEFKTLTEKYKEQGVKVEFKFELGSISQKIIDHISNEKIDMVIMGSHGVSGLKEALIGSNAEKIVRKSPVPVLVVKNYFNGNVTNIVFPNTLEIEHQEDLVMKVKALQDLFKAKLHIVHINTPLNFTSDIVTMVRLKAFASRFMIKDCTLNVFNHQNEEEGINLFARSVNAELIAMGTHGRTGIAHLVNGSLAEDVTNHADSLVWTYTLRNKPVEAETK
jgi:nucleotide-binding universal stress UspA family protein